MPDGRRGILDDAQRREIIAIVAVTKSWSRAADYIGCTVGVIEAAARRDLEFRFQLQKAESTPAIVNMNKINVAAKDVRHWRAAAWVLERLYPEDYALRRPRSMSTEQIRRMLYEFASMILDEIVDENARARIDDRLDTLARKLAAGPGEEELDEPQRLAE
jgi:hypothetical protein